MEGKIIKGIAGFYYVDVKGKGIYECKARGIFRKDNIKPLIGDNVVIEVLDEHEMLGNLLEILPRENELIRPTVSNISKALIVFAATNPKIHYNLLDRFLVITALNDIDTTVCINKIDLISEDDAKAIKAIYEKAQYKVILTSTKLALGLDELKAELDHHTTVFAGPSGVGKSSLLNAVQSHVVLETGKISEKIKRGKHTTRHAELLLFDQESYVVDTPGFSSLNIDQIEADELKGYFREFDSYRDRCKFNACNHINEPKCGVKQAVRDDLIAESRYESYLKLYSELELIRRY